MCAGLSAVQLEHEAVPACLHWLLQPCMLSRAFCTSCNRQLPVVSCKTHGMAVQMLPVSEVCAEVQGSVLHQTPHLQPHPGGG